MEVFGVLSDWESFTIGVLVVLSENNGSEKAFTNLSGVDVTTAKNLNTELLAPGGDPGRLVVFSKAAVSALEERL